MKASLFFPALTGLCRLGAAHFVMSTPKSIGFNDDDESKGPCGGFTPDFSSKDVVDFHVGGEALGMRLSHPQCNWLFRATLDQKAQSGWEQLFPIVMQSGLGDFCEPRVTVPESFVGKKGVVSVVSAAVDGLLYQCIAANFVTGSAEPPSACKNASSVKASFVDDPKLSALVGKSGDSSNSAPSSTGAQPQSTKTGAASALQASLPVAGLAALLSMAVLGRAHLP